MDIYGVDGVIHETIHEDLLAPPVYSRSFDYAAVEEMSQRFAATQGVVQASAATVSTILLRLPLPDSEEPTVDLIGRFHYLGPQDPSDPSSTVLGMYGGVEGVPPAPGRPAADLNFYMHIDPRDKWVKGGVVIGDTFFSFVTVNGAVVITAFNYEVGLCRLEQQGGGGGGGAEPGHGVTKNMTLAERRAYRQEKMRLKKVARQERHNATKAAREEKRARKKAGGGSGWKKQRWRQLAPRQPHSDAHGHGHGHAHDHAAMHRQLQTTPFLIFIDFAPPSGYYSQWNQGLPINITQCASTALTSAVRSQIAAAVREDYAPFNVEVSWDGSKGMVWARRLARDSR